MRKRTINRCVDCGKFFPWEQLHGSYEPDTAFTSEKIEHLCDKCYKEARR